MKLLNMQKFFFGLKYMFFISCRGTRKAYTFFSHSFTAPQRVNLASYSAAFISATVLFVGLFVLQNDAVVSNRGRAHARLSSLSHSSNISDKTSLDINISTSVVLPGLSSQQISPASSRELISVLKKSGSWQDMPLIEVSPLFLKKFPNDLGQLEVGLKKKVFFNSLLPAVLMAMREVQQERHTLVGIIKKLNKTSKTIDFSEYDTEWHERLNDAEIHFVANITDKYRHTNGAELLKRINVMPVSLVLAQGALESSWGTSRFAHLGNNIFGMWTWGENGIVPLNRPEGMTHKLAEYDSILDSVRAYILTINCGQAYSGLREVRAKTMDPIALSYGLLSYSERGQAYIDSLLSVMSYNDLAGYDQCRLTSIETPFSTVAFRET